MENTDVPLAEGVRWAVLSLTASFLLGCQAGAQADPPIQAREQLNPVVWMQRSTDYPASALQTYRLATGKLAEAKS
ncbi:MULTISPECIES: hypothetical protein [Cupriavidus]|uniref:hypothetical protein n=1 Tax=Cupriavidus sp. DF5525 TaxID=3160989 RepID=UPI0032DEB735